MRFPATAALRPTPDRVRETLFNWLGQDLTGRRTLDLYAGSGALSLEALSRGAALAVAVERDVRLVAALQENAALLGLAGLATVRAEAKRFISRESRDFDVIFLDPPFDEDPWSWLLPACGQRIAPGGVLYAEAGVPLEPGEAFEVVRSAKAGQVYYHLLALAERPGMPT